MSVRLTPSTIHPLLNLLNLGQIWRAAYILVCGACAFLATEALGRPLRCMFSVLAPPQSSSSCLGELFSCVFAVQRSMCKCLVPLLPFPFRKHIV